MRDCKEFLQLIDQSIYKAKILDHQFCGLSISVLEYYALKKRIEASFAKLRVL